MESVSREIWALLSAIYYSRLKENKSNIFMEQFRYRNRQIATLTHSLSPKGGKQNTRSAFDEPPILHHHINLPVKEICMVLGLSCSPLLLLSREELAVLDASRAVLRPSSLSRVAKWLTSCLTDLEMQIPDTISLTEETRGHPGQGRAEEGTSLVLLCLINWGDRESLTCFRRASCFGNN